MKNEFTLAFNEVIEEKQLPKEIILKAEKMLQKIRRSGGNPIGLAAGAFYYACKKKKNKISIGSNDNIAPGPIEVPVNTDN